MPRPSFAPELPSWATLREWAGGLRNRVGGAAGLAVLAAGCAPGAADRAAGDRPRNVILISIDTLRPDHLSCYGHQPETSPAIDALAARGARFTDVTAAAPWTLPSHATMLTGLYPSHHGVKSHTTRLAEHIVTVAEELQQHGFETLAVVNTHNVGAPQYGLGQGFHHFQYISESDEDPGTKRIRTPDMGEVVVATAQELLGKRPQEKPWFLFLHFYDVHTDLTPKEEFRRAFVEPYEGKLDGRTQQLNGVRNRNQQLDEADLRFLRQMYDAEIRTLDALLERFFAWLESQGLLQDTLVMITSDHGEEFQEHGSVLHGRTQYQELLKVPWIISGPGVPPGTVIDWPVHGVDVTPTLLGLMGFDSSVPRDGEDVSHLWSSAQRTQRTLFAEADQDNRQADLYDTKVMVRSGAEKLILDRVSGHAELYDLEHDPEERNNLAPGEPERVRVLGEQLRRFRAGEVAPELIQAPTEEDQRKLDALGYGGGKQDE